MNNNSEYLTDTYHILGEKPFPLTKHMVTLYKVQSTKKIPKNIHIAIISSKNIYYLKTVIKLQHLLQHLFKSASDAVAG